MMMIDGQGKEHFNRGTTLDRVLFLKCFDSDEDAACVKGSVFAVHKICPAVM